MRSFFVLTFLFVAISLGAQEVQLAQQYFRNGEYEKASELYEKLYKANERNDFYFDRYVDCLLALERYQECEKIVARNLKRNPQNVNLYVVYGKLFERQYRDEEAMEQYRAAIANLPRDRYSIIRLANAFSGLTKYELAIQTYEKGAKLLKDEELFAYNLGDLYRRKGDSEKMIENYLNSLQANPDRLGNLQTLFQRYLLEEDFRELKRQLYERIQTNEAELHYVELLTWVFIQEEDYANALRQVRALDRRLRENGARVFGLAEIAADDGDYQTAIDAYEYIVEKKGATSFFYLDAKREALRCRRLQLVEGYDYTREELASLQEEYVRFLDEFGRSKLTAPIMAQLAYLEAFYLGNLENAIAILNQLLDFPNLDRYVEAEAKLSLADFYLMQGEIWEATLLYSQVDKAFKEDILGHEARFRNAKLSYYNGDFQWAQAQFDVLKASTSKLIANDALDLSVFIMDNLGLDTTATALQMFADAELLIFQNRFERARAKMDSLQQKFPGHSLEDDVLWLKARIHKKKREFEPAAAMLQKIIDDHSEGIRADNAMFELAELYENQLDNKEKAMELYEKIFIEFNSSTFAVEARKRYRKLRGDTVQ